MGCPIHRVIYVCLYTWVYGCIRMYVYMFMHLSVCVSVCMCVYECIHGYICAYRSVITYVDICIHTYIHVYVDTYIQKYMQTETDWINTRVKIILLLVKAGTCSLMYVWHHSYSHFMEVMLKDVKKSIRVVKKFAMKDSLWYQIISITEGKS